MSRSTAQQMVSVSAGVAAVGLLAGAVGPRTGRATAKGRALHVAGRVPAGSW